jgi:hypothetical protein
VIGVSQRPGTITAVSLRLLYLIFAQLLRWLALWGARSWAWVADSGDRWPDMIPACRCGCCT